MKGRHSFDHSQYLVTPGKKIRLDNYDPAFTNELGDKKEAKDVLKEDKEALAGAQELLWASEQQAVLIIFQALDAAGKDSTIKHVMSGVNPQGCEVHSFKAPSEEEKKHHFLWRPARVLPGAGRIAIFNRSYYEEVLVVRVHPDFLKGQLLPEKIRGKDLKKIWEARYRSINKWEKLIMEQGICIIKFFLNVSKGEQKKRFLERLDRPEKNYKFSAADVEERSYWNEYRKAYEDMLNATSTRWAPWYIIPADKKWFTRAVVADIIASRINKLKLKIPELSESELAKLKKARKELENVD
ncbi:MAG: polyphosphate kinase 2 family protein [Bacteroidales bacterium]|nr:polyphosphate kinase 2 family protein [Bacteroidales bacterium]